MIFFNIFICAATLNILVNVNVSICLFNFAFRVVVILVIHIIYSIRARTEVVFIPLAKYLWYDEKVSLPSNFTFLLHFSESPPPPPPFPKKAYKEVYFILKYNPISIPHLLNNYFKKGGGGGTTNIKQSRRRRSGLNKFFS